MGEDKETLISKTREVTSSSTSGYRGMLIGKTCEITRIIYECPHKHRVELQALWCAEKKRKQVEKKRERIEKAQVSK